MKKSEKKQLAALATVVEDPKVAEKLADMVDSSLDTADTLDSNSISLITNTFDCFVRY